MTGWQGNDRGQGDWNQPFGPDPHTNQYGTDPYSNPADQYGADPYGGGGYEQYGQPTNPYTQPQPYPQYQTGGFPAQGYGPPPPPPKRSKLPMILSLVAIVIIIGAVVAIVLVNRKDSQQTADPDPKTSSSSEKTSPSERDPSDRNPTSTKSGGDDWIAVDNTADSGLTYQVPPDWKASSTPRASGLGVDFTGNADYGKYDCEGFGYVRSFAASGDVQGKSGEDLDLKATMDDFAKAFGATYYGDEAKIDVPLPTDIDIDGKKAMTLTAKVTPTVTKPACQATKGEVALVGILLETDGKPTGVAMLVVVNDLDGGPETPKPIEASVSQDILKTVKLGS